MVVGTIRFPADISSRLNFQREGILLHYITEIEEGGVSCIFFFSNIGIGVFGVWGFKSRAWNGANVMIPK